MQFRTALLENNVAHESNQTAAHDLIHNKALTPSRAKGNKGWSMNIRL